MKCKVTADVFQLDVRRIECDSSAEILHNDRYVVENEVTDTVFEGYIRNDGEKDVLILTITETLVKFIIDSFSIINSDTIVVPRGMHSLEGDSNLFSELLNCLKIPVTNISDINSALTDIRRNYVDEVAFLIDYHETHGLGYENGFIPFTGGGAKLCGKIQKEINRCKENISGILVEAKNDPERKWFPSGNHSDTK